MIGGSCCTFGSLTAFSEDQQVHVVVFYTGNAGTTLDMTWDLDAVCKQCNLLVNCHWVL